MFLTSQDLKIRKEKVSKACARIVIEPLSAGYANTLGNSLRRILLSSIKGAAPTQVEIDGVSHQFTSIKGVKEDVVELTLNLKRLRVKLYSDKPVVLTLDQKGPKKVKASDFECPSDAEIVSKDLHIATLADAKSCLKLSLVVEPGFGYVPAEERQISKIGVIVLDSVFSPVKSVNFTVGSTRVGHKSGLDKLTLEITTDETVDPFVAFKDAATILSDFFSRLSTGKESVKEEPKVEESSAQNSPNYEPSDVMIEELHLPTRTINALRKSGIKTLEDLTKLSKDNLSQIRNLGEKSIIEIGKLLEKEGL
ncbi:MAG: DNA-directed RNA polymerase subunit alpha [Patescibacteria group bacterium]|nr:DNA-directed RNA polymerase subunit alpha [Patescibacteria group bacterium]